MTMLKVIITIAVICGVLGRAGAIREQRKFHFYRSWLIAAVKVFAGVLIAAFYFLFSAGMSPEGKSQAISQFSPLIMTKTWLAPFAAWALISFYFFEIVRPQRARGWVVLGLIAGFVGSLGCSATVFLISKPLSDPNLTLLILFIPVIYLPIWYGIAAFRAYRQYPVRPYHLWLALTAQLAVWMWAAKHALEVYEALPPYPPDCYVVSASAHGYPWLVRDSKQLARMRAFEQLWKVRWPVTHRHFRRIYNAIGPILARAIRHPFLASIGYLTIKPFEILAVGVMFLCSSISNHNSR